MGFTQKVGYKLKAKQSKMSKKTAKIALPTTIVADGNQFEIGKAKWKLLELSICSTTKQKAISVKEDFDITPRGWVVVSGQLSFESRMYVPPT